MAFNFTQNDYKLIIGGFVAALVVSFGALAAGVGPMVELPLDFLTFLTTVAGVYFIYKTAGTFGGDVGRYLAVMGVGLVYYALTFIPHTQLHIMQVETGMSQIGPVNLLGVFMFQHIATIWVFVLTAYGFYLFWRGGKR